MYLTTDEVAERLRLSSKAALLQLRHRGAAPPAVRIGAKLLWPEAELDAWMADKLRSDPRSRVAS